MKILAIVGEFCVCTTAEPAYSYIVYSYSRVKLNSLHLYFFTTKGCSRRLEKIYLVWMTMMIAASLMWAGAAEKPEQSKRI